MRFSPIAPAFIALLALAPGRAPAQYNPYGRETALEGMLSGQAAVQNGAAAIVGAQAAVARSVGEAAAANVKALESLESARAHAIENSVKSVSTYYEKRKLFQAYQGAAAGQRPKREDMLRYSKSGLVGHAVPVDAQGKVQWPELFLREEFTPRRIVVDAAYAQRSPTPNDFDAQRDRAARAAVGQMRTDLRRLMTELSPAEYAAARRLLDSLALELQLGPRSETLLKTPLPPAPPGGTVAGK